MFAVVLKTNNESPWTDEFDSKSHKKAYRVHLFHIRPNLISCHVSFFLYLEEIELSCLIESISTTSPRIEWKKITNDGPSYVYFDKRISGNI